MRIAHETVLGEFDEVTSAEVNLVVWLLEQNLWIQNKLQSKSIPEFQSISKLISIFRNPLYAKQLIISNGSKVWNPNAYVKVPTRSIMNGRFAFNYRRKIITP